MHKVGTFFKPIVYFLYVFLQNNIIYYDLPKWEPHCCSCQSLFYFYSIPYYCAIYPIYDLQYLLNNYVLIYWSWIHLLLLNFSLNQTSYTKCLCPHKSLEIKIQFLNKISLKNEGINEIFYSFQTNHRNKLGYSFWYNFCWVYYWFSQFFHSQKVEEYSLPCDQIIGLTDQNHKLELIDLVSEKTIKEVLDKEKTPKQELENLTLLQF